MANLAFNNFLYLYHTNEWLLLPEYPDQVTDTMQVNFASTNALSRTAPVFTYSNSGPRTVQVQLNLHRDMVNDLNFNVASMKVEVGEDYVDHLLARLQAIALPKYNVNDRGVIPPMIALKFGEAIFIKGVVSSSVSVVYQKPLDEDDKYTQVTVNFEVKEVDAFDAVSIGDQGSFRGITSTFKQGIYK